METKDLFTAIMGYTPARNASIYIVIERVLLRIADHQANNVNFECFNDLEDYDAIVNVVISDNYVSEKEFDAYLDKKDMPGQMIVVGASDNVTETAEYILKTLKNIL